MRKIFVVRNGPDLSVVHPYPAIKDLRGGSKYLIGCVGKIDKQDCLPKLVNSIEYMINSRGFTDFKVLIIGDGTERYKIEGIVREKNSESILFFMAQNIIRKNYFHCCPVLMYAWNHVGNQQYQANQRP